MAAQQIPMAKFTQAFASNRWQSGLKIYEKIPKAQKNEFWNLLSNEQREWVRKARVALGTV